MLEKPLFLHLIQCYSGFSFVMGILFHTSLRDSLFKGLPWNMFPDSHTKLGEVSREDGRWEGRSVGEEWASSA